MKCPKCGHEIEHDSEDNEESTFSKIMIMLICVAIVVFLTCAVMNSINHEPDNIYFSGGIHTIGSHDSNVVLFQEEGVYYMIIPTDPGNLTGNYTRFIGNSTGYNTYYWNDTGWIYKE